MNVKTSYSQRQLPIGVQPSVVLPYELDGSIDWSSYQKQIKFALSDVRVTGLLINGHASDNSLTTDEEKEEIVRFTRSLCDHKIYLTTGVYAESTGSAVTQAKRLEAAGADAVLVFQPNGWALACDPESIILHHTEIHNAVACPVMLYQASINAGKFAYSMDVLDTLVKLERVKGIKEGSWEIKASELVHRRVKSARPDISVYGSGDEHLLHNYFMGTDGSQASLAAVIPKTICDLWESATKKDWVTAKILHEKIQPLAHLIYSAQPPSRVTARLKACLNILGILTNDRVRMPLVSLPEYEVAELSRALKHAR